PKRSIPLRDSKGYPSRSSSSIVLLLVVVLGLVLPAPNGGPAQSTQSHRARYRSRARNRFLPGEGEKKPPSLLSFTSVSQSDSLFTSNGQSSITSTSTSTIGDRHSPALPPPNQMFSGCPKLPWSTLGCDVPWHNKVRRHSRTRQEQRRSKKPSQFSSFSGLVPPAPRNANLPDPISPHRARSRARDRFLPDEGAKRPPSCFRSRLSLKETRYLPGNGQSSITSTSTRTIGDPSPSCSPAPKPNVFRLP
ncbi:MAG: hypothetical protein QOG92_1179, partial [Verrucomicrobiota bacterium]|nr:hypothetical protein [Verrucomicrobiota bacterium]